MEFNSSGGFMYLENHNILAIQELHTRKVMVSWRHKNSNQTILVVVTRYNGQEDVVLHRVPLGSFGFNFDPPRPRTEMTFELIDEFGRTSEVEKITVM
jgi:hypothetical protein